MTTREKIMLEALTLFSARGFDPVSVRDIARAVGIKESSLYNHFKNKQDLFDCILNEYAQRWDAVFSRFRLIGEDGRFAADERTISLYQNMTEEQFSQLADGLFDYYMTDEINVKLRRLLTIEQYRSDRIAALYKKISFDDSLDYQARLFAALMDAGRFQKTDPYALALAFFAPIFLIFYKFGGGGDLDEAKALFTRHIGHFSKTYGAQP